jgi:glycosyltransferase involved in cell wall biosynthesis
MIKILFIIDGLRAGGKERRALSLMRKLSDSKDFQIESVLLNSNIHFKEIFDLDFKCHVIDRRELTCIRIFNKIYSINKKFNSDIIHAWDTLSTLYAIPISKLNRVKLITSKITDAPPSYKRFSVYGLQSEVCFLFSNFILANSNAGLLAYKISSRKSRVIYNGFDFKRVQNLKSEQSLKEMIGVDKKFIVSMVASFSEKKDFKTFLIAAEEVLSLRDDVAFLCVGDGPKRQKLQESHQNNAILFLGKRDDVDSLINISDIGVLLSTDGEGISNSLLEFMAQGKPVLASNFDGNKELIIHEKSGVILKSNDFKELARNLINLLSNEKFHKEIGSNAKNRVIETFNLDRMIKEFAEVYKEIIFR